MHGAVSVSTVQASLLLLTPCSSDTALPLVFTCYVCLTTNSDGMGNSGERGDCAYRNPYATALYNGPDGVYNNVN
eukprot:18822-Heterococcus_DN1.PRE.2